MTHTVSIGHTHPFTERMVVFIDSYAMHLIMADQALRIKDQETAQDHIDAAATIKLNIENELAQAQDIILQYRANRTY